METLGSCPELIKLPKNDTQGEGVEAILLRDTRVVKNILLELLIVLTF